MSTKPCCKCSRPLPVDYPMDRCPTCPGWVFQSVSEQKKPMTDMEILSKHMKQPCEVCGSKYYGPECLECLSNIDYSFIPNVRPGKKCDCGKVYYTSVCRRIAYCRICARSVSKIKHPCDPFGRGFGQYRRRAEMLEIYNNWVPNQKVVMERESKRDVRFPVVHPIEPNCYLRDYLRKLRNITDAFQFKHRMRSKEDGYDPSHGIHIAMINRFRDLVISLEKLMDYHTTEKNGIVSLNKSRNHKKFIDSTCLESKRVHSEFNNILVLPSDLDSSWAQVRAHARETLSKFWSSLGRDIKNHSEAKEAIELQTVPSNRNDALNRYVSQANRNDALNRYVAKYDIVSPEHYGDKYIKRNYRLSNISRDPDESNRINLKPRRQLWRQKKR